VFWRKKALTLEQLLVNALAARDLQEAVRLLVAGADANACDADGVPALAIVASGQWPEATEALLHHGADPNTILHVPAQGLNQAHVLGFPAANGSVGVLRSLVLAGARLDAADATGLTALMSASYMGHPEVVSVLIAHGAPLEQRDERGYTALTFAANAGHPSVVRALLTAGADPATKDLQASTPIMFAAQHGHDEVVEILLGAGADPTVLGTHGLSAIGLARQNRHMTTVRLLTGERGA